MTDGPVDYFAGCKPQGYLVVLTCLSCDGQLRTVNVGQILAGRSGVVVAQCTQCGRNHRLSVTLVQFRDDTSKRDAAARSKGREPNGYPSQTPGPAFGWRRIGLEPVALERRGGK